MMLPEITSDVTKARADLGDYGIALLEGQALIDGYLQFAGLG